MNQKILATSIMLTCVGAGVSTSVQAALTNGSTLNLDAGLRSCTMVSSYQVCGITSGSYFAMDMNGDSKISSSEKTRLVGNDGLILGAIQPATGVHTGAPNGTESPGIDKPWGFFGSTGMDFTVTPSDVLSSAGNLGTVDLSGWRVAWNTISSINMGGGAWTPLGGTAAGPYYNGVANVVCGFDCNNGDTYTLDYSATVPIGDTSGFGGVKYFLHLEGTISAVPVPAAAWLFGSGLLGLASVARRRVAVQ